MKTRSIIAYILPSIVLVLTCAYLLLVGNAITNFQFLLKYSARLSFLIFTIAFSISGIHHFLNSNTTRWLLGHRREIGIAFALIHLIHLSLLILKNYLYGTGFSGSSWPSLIGGTITYVLIGLMFITSYKRFSIWISARNWRKLHLIGGYTILITFTAAYTRYTIEDLYFLPLLTLVIGIWLIRFLKFRKKTNALQQTLSVMC